MVNARLYTDASGNEVHISLWWFENDQYSLADVVSKDFFFYHLLDTIMRWRRRSGGCRYQDVRDWFMFNEFEVVREDESEPGSGVFEFPSVEIAIPGLGKRQGVLRANVSLGTTEHEIEVTFSTPNFKSENGQITRELDIPAINRLEIELTPERPVASVRAASV